MSGDSIGWRLRYCINEDAAAGASFVLSPTRSSTSDALDPAAHTADAMSFAAHGDPASPKRAKAAQKLGLQLLNSIELAEGSPPINV